MKTVTTNSMRQLTLTGRPPSQPKKTVRETYGSSGRWWASEEVPAELMYDEFIYPEDIEMECFESDPTNFDGLEPMDPKLWQEELMRREEWFKHWHKPVPKEPTRFRKNQPGSERTMRERRAREQAYGSSR